MKPRARSVVTLREAYVIIAALRRQGRVILVTGGTGYIGRHVVTRLLERGHHVRLLLPEQRTHKLPWADPPEIVTGSILDEEALFKAVTGVHVVIHLENAFWWGRRRDLERVELAGTRQLITAARAARVGRIITVSQLGASPSTAYTLLRVKGQMEDTIKASGLAYTILRSGLVFGEDDAFINHIALGMTANPLFFLMPGRGEIVLHPIYIDDLVNALVASLETVDTVDTIVEIGGAEYITLSDLLRTIMRVSGRQRMVVSVPPYMLRWLTAVFERVLPRSLMTSQWLDILATNRTARLGTAFQYFGIHPRRLEDTLMTYLPKRRNALELLRYTFRRRPRVL